MKRKIENDNEFEDKVIVGVDENSLSFSDGSAFYLEKKDRPIEPKAGMIVRFYGKGFGYPVRGLLLDVEDEAEGGEVVFYRTAQEQGEYHKQQVIERQNQQKSDFEKNREKLDQQFNSLPEAFQERVARFRKNNPDFRWEHESYELFCCSEAVKIASKLSSPDEVKAFHKMKWEEQRKLVPTLSNDHSGNTFGAACVLARAYLTDPKLVQQQHGALCPLVGCKDYGCVPREQ